METPLSKQNIGPAQWSGMQDNLQTYLMAMVLYTILLIGIK